VPVVEEAAAVAVAEPALVFPAEVAVAEVAAEVGVAAVLVLDPERSNRPSHHK